MSCTQPTETRVAVTKRGESRGGGGRGASGRRRRSGWLRVVGHFQGVRIAAAASTCPKAGAKWGGEVKGASRALQGLSLLSSRQCRWVPAVSARCMAFWILSQAARPAGLYLAAALREALRAPVDCLPRAPLSSCLPPCLRRLAPLGEGEVDARLGKSGAHRQSAWRPAGPDVGTGACASSCKANEG